MKPKVYIDGKDGTTGLQIYSRLAARDDIELLLIDEAKRKDISARRELIHAADLVFLCLPDAAAVEAVRLAEHSAARIIDASTAHRTAPGWAYGFPELSGERRDAIIQSRRVANPGCHATGFISVVYPLIAAGVLSENAFLSCFSLTGYSGGGKKMIAQYETSDRASVLDSPALYAMGQNHKHLPEMRVVCGLEHPPVFTPVVDDYYAGMASTVPFCREQLRGIASLRDLRDLYARHYAGCPVIAVPDAAPDKLYSGVPAGKDSLSILVSGNDERFTVTALFDNLGKGASGAAVQNMNLMLGFDETKGLNL